VLLALALIALLASVLVGASSAMLKDKPTTADEVFWKVTQQARKIALSTENDVRISFDAKEKFFLLDDGINKRTYAVPGPYDLSVDLLSAQKGGNSILVGGVLVETQTLPFVTFYSDGTCTPFRVQFRAAGGAHVLAIDPWTCAGMLKPPDPNNPVN